MPFDTYYKGLTDGKIFIELLVVSLEKDSFFISTCYYTAKDGFVFSIDKDGHLHKSGDTVEDLYVQCALLPLPYTIGWIPPAKSCTVKFDELLAFIDQHQ